MGAKRLSRQAFTIISVVGVLATGLALDGCAASPWAGIMCDYNPQNPHQSNGAPKYMDGKGTFSCKGGVVTNVTIKIRLEKRDAKAHWAVVPGSSNSITKSSVQSGQKITLTTAKNVSCKSGHYRTAAWAAGSYRGVRKTSPAWGYREAEVVCR